MMRRLIWFVGGAVAGVVGVRGAERKARAVVRNLAPTTVARKAGSTVREQVRRVGDAARDGRSAMRAREDELRARLDGRAVNLADELSDGDTVLVDGRPVEPGQVIVLREVADDSRRRSRGRRG